MGTSVQVEIGVFKVSDGGGESADRDAGTDKGDEQNGCRAFSREGHQQLIPVHHDCGRIHASGEECRLECRAIGRPNTPGSRCGTGCGNALGASRDTLLQVHRPIGHLVEFGQLMARDQHGLALGGHSAHQLPQLDSSLRVETRRGFIE